MYHIEVQISKATFIIVINSREGLLKVILDFEAVYLISVPGIDNFNDQ